jgi:hypothetical protein
MQGVKYTYIYAGAKKTDGNPHQPLSKSAKSDIQAEVDREYEMFVECVARNRDMWPQKVRNTEAGVLFGTTAVGKLADECMSYDEAIAALTEQANSSATKRAFSDRNTDKAVAALPENIVASETKPDNNTRNDVTESRRHEGAARAMMPAIAPHKTATSEKPWNGPKAKANLKNDGTEPYYRSAFAWQDSAGDPTVKASYKFIHHEVSGGGDVGAANIKACQSSIGILNGGRGGTVVSKPDRRGIYRHVAKHLKDAELEPAPLAHSNSYYAGVLAEALETGDKELHELAFEYLLQADDAEESNTEGEEPMALDTAAKRAKKAETEEEEAKKGKQDDGEEEDADDEEDDDEEEDDDDKKKSESRKSESRKSEARKGRKAESDDKEDSRKAANGAARKIASLCQLANVPELAVTYISGDFTVDEVIEDLNERRSKASAEHGIGMTSYVTGQAPGSGATLDQVVRQAAVAGAPFVNDPVAYAQARYQAMTQALRANPQIYESYMDERDRVIQLSPGGRGKVLTEYVLGAQRRYMAQLGLSTAIEDVPVRRSMV